MAATDLNSLLQDFLTKSADAKPSRTGAGPAFPTGGAPAGRIGSLSRFQPALRGRLGSARGTLTAGAEQDRAFFEDRLAGIADPGRQGRRAFGESLFKSGGFLEQFMELLSNPEQLFALLSGGGGGGPNRADLLDPRLAGIERERGRTERNIRNRAASLGRSGTGSATTELLTDLGAQAGEAGSRARGDVDTLLEELGLARFQAQVPVLQQLLGQFGKFTDPSFIQSLK